MAIFNSPTIKLNKSARYTFQKIENLNNLKNIMPAQIKDFESDTNSCSFKMKGMPKLQLEICERIPFKKISLRAKESQVPFSLDCYISDQDDQCQVRLEINAELNMMMTMMVEKPLTQFLDVLASKIKNL